MRPRFVITLIITLALCYFPLCYRIDALSVRQWDESRNAVNALEMHHNHNYIVRYYDGMPENWETKPPLLIWLQVASMKVFGMNELAIRFPTLLATMATVFLLIFYFRRSTPFYTGCIAALVLVASNGYIDRHIARTGDHDALLIFFLLALILLFFRYIKATNPQKYLMPFMALLFTLAVFTKSVAVLFILPGLAINLFLFKSGKKLFKDAFFYFPALASVVVIGAYYVIREHFQPGYLSLVWHEKFLRYTNPEGRFDSGTPWYYLINFLQGRFIPWIYILIPACFVLPHILPSSEKPFFRYILINATVFFLLISMGSKNLWYDGLLYPLFAIMLALFLVYGAEYLIIRFPAIPLRKFIWIPLLLIILFPYTSVVKRIGNTHEYPWDREIYSMSYVLRDPALLSQLPGPLIVVYNGYPAHLLFYVKMNQSAGNHVQLQPTNELEPGQTVMFSQTAIGDSIQQHFTLDTLLKKDPVVVGTIRSISPNR